VNRQRDETVPLAWLRSIATRSVRRLRIRHAGVLPVTFVDSRTMRRLNRAFLHHDRLTDVLSFRYAANGTSRRRSEPTSIAGEILVAPAAARAYATRHGIPYRQELARYVVHGLLHWLGHEDRTPAQQRRMRQLEDRLLTLADIRPQISDHSKHRTRKTKSRGVFDH